MPTRQEQIDSYRFALRRLVAAIVTWEGDTAPGPAGRPAGAILASVLIAALGLAGAVVYGVVGNAGGQTWRNPAAVIIERETGAKYVYRDGRLHPVLNFASALLLARAANPEIVVVSRRALAGTPRGTAYGIPGAPDSLPMRSRLRPLPWSVCSRPAAGTGTRARPLSVLSMYPDGPPGRPAQGRSAEAAAGRPLDAGAGLLVSTVDDESTLIWNGRRYRIRDPDLVLPALGWAGQPRVPVASAFLNALPAGPDLARIPVPGRGRPAPGPPGARVGLVYMAENQSGGRDYAVALADGLYAITQVMADLLLTDPDTAGVLGQRQAIRLGQADLAAAQRRRTLIPTGDDPPPAGTPRLVRPVPGTATCAAIGDGRDPVSVRLDVPGRDAGEPVVAGSPGSDRAVRADRILVPPGGGAVIEAVASPADPTGVLGLVTELGVRYPVPDRDVLAVLGYAGVVPVRVPAEVAALLPIGPGLDPAAAQRPA
jgi:type VII secretion protein EccB